MVDQGILTNIQRFSLNDGPGIRTTVFFKGCNMACAWCHNPETISLTPELLNYPEQCIACGACIRVCPHDAIHLEHNKAQIDRAKCTNCGLCAEVCFTGALEFVGRSYSIDEVMDEILQDAVYYRNSGGGVTLSGGEAMLQADFANLILKRCQAEGIATAIESNLNYPFALLETLLPNLDLVMADLKVLDDEKHLQYTDRSNRLILENIRHLDASGIPYIIRTPVIPGVNDNVEAISAIARFLEQMENLLYFELLNFNPLGDAKYRGLERSNPYHHAKPLEEEKLKILQQAAQLYAPEVVLG